MLTTTVHGQSHGGDHDMMVRHDQHNDSSAEGIMDLAQHSDHSN